MAPEAEQVGFALLDPVPVAVQRPGNDQREEKAEYCAKYDDEKETEETVPNRTDRVQVE